MGENKLVLPPGFQFDPTDEDLIVYFLRGRAANVPGYPNIIPDLDSYAADPYELNDKAFYSKGGWYFFSRLKQDRSTGKGFWKELGYSEAIFTSNGDEVGMKNYLVFCAHQVGSLLQTNWKMQEYHLLNNGNFSKKASQIQIQDMSEWVLCRVHDEANLVLDRQGGDCNDEELDIGVELSYLDEVFFSMEDEQDEITFPS